MFELIYTWANIGFPYAYYFKVYAIEVIDL